MLELKRIKTGDDIPQEALADLLCRLQYEKKEFIAHPGEFAVRGGLVDIYPLTYRTPVRLEFIGDKIEAIYGFQLSDFNLLANYDEVFLIPVSGVFKKRIDHARKIWEEYEPVRTHKNLSPGDYVVHVQYGIGKFLGVKAIQAKGKKKKHLAVEYANHEILYLDIEEPLERYIGGEGRAPKLTKLHSKDWERAKEKTRQAVSFIAKDLLEIQAKRSLGQGFAFEKDHPWQKEFEDTFPYEETPDQIRAAEEVKRDMESPHPMDRLLAGDVGYGKTEVAIRAAFKAVTNGKQAAVLVPTTVLAEQHYVVFKERMKQFPVTVEVLSRFQNRKKQSGIITSLKQGSTDIVIGTHRLLSKDVTFKDLGIVVIDEEQRFGVRHKERLKQLRASVDVLTLTATPIPRTLYMTLVGVRDMSAINTPPKNRMPIKTFIREYDDLLVQEALSSEISRGGQAYFIHNRVASIEKIYRHLSGQMPHIRFGFAHGQMPPHLLEEVMKNFMDHQIDCLIATSIIESGIDIPNVNTIIINRADSFGLSDLYQLRGRVGRFQEKRQAFAYFLIPKNYALSGDAHKRLGAIERFTELGSGFKIALEDLEIRGAGNLLGSEQSGFIHAVGFDLYCRMLKKAVGEQKKA